VVSETAAPFLERGFELHELPDASGQGRALALVGRGPVGRGARDRSAAFVGRHREIDLLQSRLESAIRGQGQIVGISGEAGIGKSRLLFEFRDGLAGPAVTYVEGQCRSYGAAIPYLPVLDVLKAMCAITDGDSPATVADKVRSSLLEAGMDLLETAPYLLHLLGVEPDGPPSGWRRTRPRCVSSRRCASSRSSGVGSARWSSWSKTCTGSIAPRRNTSPRSRKSSPARASC